MVRVRVSVSIRVSVMDSVFYLKKMFVVVLVDSCGVAIS